MGIGYQRTDRKVIDYDLWYLPGEGPALRGPPRSFDTQELPHTLCCIGAAQTFGRFVLDPFPAQVGRLIQRPTLNLGSLAPGQSFTWATPLLWRSCKAPAASLYR